MYLERVGRTQISSQALNVTYAMTSVTAAVRLAAHKLICLCPNLSNWLDDYFKLQSLWGHWFESHFCHHIR